MNPSLLLLDEPLSNLDAALREKMRVELKSLQRELGLAAVYVTHDQAEAMMLADRLVVMHDGRIVQEGRPEDVFSRPKSRFVAGFLGTTNLIEGRIADVNGASACLEIRDLGLLHGRVADDARPNLRAGSAAWLSIRPMAVSLVTARPACSNALEGRICTRTFLGDFTEYGVRTNDLHWRVHAISPEPVALGANAWISFSPDAATIMPDT